MSCSSRNKIFHKPAKFHPDNKRYSSHEVDLVRNPHVGFCRWSLGNEPRSSLSHDPTNQTSWAWRTDLLISNSSQWPKKNFSKFESQAKSDFWKISNQASRQSDKYHRVKCLSIPYLTPWAEKGNLWALRSNKPSKPMNVEEFPQLDKNPSNTHKQNISLLLKLSSTNPLSGWEL